MRATRLALFGGGKGAVPHLRPLPGVPEVELVAIAEVNAARRSELWEGDHAHADDVSLAEYRVAAGGAGRAGAAKVPVRPGG